MRPIHSGKLERFLGTEKVEEISRNMRGWYGPPIAVAGVPGNVWAQRDGDFAGRLNCGSFLTGLDFAVDRLRRYVKRVARHAVRRQFAQLNAGFASISDMISEATAGSKMRRFDFMKIGATGVVGGTNTLWRVTGGTPAGGAAGSAAPGGRVPDDTVTGAFPFSNPAGGDTQHLVSSYILGSQVSTILLYDRLFDVAKTMSSSATEAVTGVPNRYTNTTAGTIDSCEGNFLFIEIFAALSATAHNWTVCQYSNQAGTGPQSLPSVTGNSSGIIDRLDQPTFTWFCPLVAGDTGVQKLTQMQNSSAAVTGSINFCIGHPLAWMPVPIINMVCERSHVATAFNLVRIFDNACLAFLEVIKSVTTATNYTGSFLTLAG